LVESFDKTEEGKEFDPKAVEEETKELAKTCIPELYFLLNKYQNQST
jgi:hypothetical protein